MRSSRYLEHAPLVSKGLKPSEQTDRPVSRWRRVGVREMNRHEGQRDDEQRGAHPDPGAEAGARRQRDDSAKRADGYQHADGNLLRQAQRDQPMGRMVEATL